MNGKGCRMKKCMGGVPRRGFRGGVGTGTVAVLAAAQNAIDNTEYPIRFFANLFRGEWGGAWDETRRFVVNTTVGSGGSSIPQSTEWTSIRRTLRSPARWPPGACPGATRSSSP